MIMVHKSVSGHSANAPSVTNVNTNNIVDRKMQE